MVIQVALYDSELVHTLQKLRQGLSDSAQGSAALDASSIRAFEKGKSAAIVEFKRRIGVGPKGRVAVREGGTNGGGRRKAGCAFEMLCLTRDWDVLRLGEVASSKAVEGRYRGFEVCSSGCEAGKRAGRAVSRGYEWSSAGGEGRKGGDGDGGGVRVSRSRGRSSESKGRMLRSVSEVVQDLVWGICEVRGWGGRLISVAPGVIGGVASIEPVSVSGLMMSEV